MEKKSLKAHELASKIFDIVDRLLEREQNKIKGTNFVSTAKLRWVIKTARKEVVDQLKSVTTESRRDNAKKEIEPRPEA